MCLTLLFLVSLFQRLLDQEDRRARWLLGWQFTDDLLEDGNACRKTWAKFLQCKSFATHSKCKDGFCSKSTEDPSIHQAQHHSHVRCFAGLGKSYGKNYFHSAVHCGGYASHMSNINWQESVPALSATTGWSPRNDSWSDSFSRNGPVHSTQWMVERLLQ